jgi:hypothetical protein
MQTAGKKPTTRSQKTTAEPDAEQSKRFMEAARELGCDEDEAHFEEALRKIGRHKQPTDPPKKTAPKKDKAAH